MVGGINQPDWGIQIEESIFDHCRDFGDGIKVSVWLGGANLLELKEIFVGRTMGIISALVLTLSGCAQGQNEAKYDTLIEFSEVTRIQNLLDCGEIYPLVSDAYSAAKMKGFYCVSGVRENFRLFKVFDDPEVMLNDIELYEPLQTGGRKLAAGKNWFMFGLPDDIEVALASTQLSSPGTNSKAVYSPRQNTCMGLMTSALDFTFNGTDQGKATVENAEKFFRGAGGAYEKTVALWGQRVSEAYAVGNGPLIEQTLSSASLNYRDFCLTQD